MSDTVLITIRFTAKPEKIDELSQALAEAFKQTRQYPGCMSIRADRHSENNQILLVEEWESMKQYEEYIAWRISRGEKPESLDPFMDAPPVFEVWAPNVG
jgi:quinol monooxygenase YgiN